MSEHDEKKIKITHPKHGEAQCSEHQLAEFIGLGWESVEDKKPAKGDDKKGK